MLCCKVSDNIAEALGAGQQLELALFEVFSWLLLMQGVRANSGRWAGGADRREEERRRSREADRSREAPSRSAAPQARLHLTAGRSCYLLLLVHRALHTARMDCQQ